MQNWLNIEPKTFDKKHKPTPATNPLFDQHAATGADDEGLFDLFDLYDGEA